MSEKVEAHFQGLKAELVSVYEKIWPEALASEMEKSAVIRRKGK